MIEILINIFMGIVVAGFGLFMIVLPIRNYIIKSWDGYVLNLSNYIFLGFVQFCGVVLIFFALSLFGVIKFV